MTGNHTPARLARLSIAVGAVLIAALLVLAWLQYRWITRVADAERDRLRAYIDNGSRQAADEFDREISLILRALTAGPPDAASLAVRCRQFQSSHLAETKLVTAIYSLDDRKLQRYDDTSRRFLDIAWPAALLLLRDRIEGSRPPRGQAIDAGIPALAVVRNPPPRGPEGERPPQPDPERGPVPRRPPHQWLVVVFDRDYIAATWLPELVARFLRADANTDLAVRITTTGPDAAVLYSVNAGGVNFDHPASSAPLFSRRLLNQGAFAPPGPPMSPQPGLQSPWRIEVVHRAGSLENAVEHTRRANLLISGVTLLMMASALAVILVTTSRAQALARAQLEFVAGVSHELRTPMAVICSAADNLADGVVTNEQGVRRYGAVIRTEGRRLAGMVEQILRFAGIQSGRARYERQPVRVETVVDAAIDGCADTIAKAGCTLERDIPTGLPEIEADPTALTHALRNLVENAAVHGASGHWIGVSAAERNGAVDITVADRGAGIQPTETSRIFDPFYRGSRALRGQIHGFGLGLALVRRIVDAHSGSVKVESDSRGTRFLVSIPKVQR